jgi:hypothetical protein
MDEWGFTGEGRTFEDVASPMLVQLGGQPEAQSTTCVRGKSRISCRISLQNMGVIRSD